MKLDFDDAVARGLRGYVRMVTAALWLSGECSCVEAERPASAYVALDGRLADFPDLDVALVWNEDDGWAVAVETHGGEDLIVLAHMGSNVLPPPRDVAEWVESVFRDEHLDRVSPPEVRPVTDLANRLAPYAAAAFAPSARGRELTAR